MGVAAELARSVTFVMPTTAEAASNAFSRTG